MKSDIFHNCTGQSSVLNRDQSFDLNLIRKVVLVVVVAVVYTL